MTLESPPWTRIALLVEAAAAGVALLIPIAPSTTGSEWSPARLLWPQPSYAGEVVMWFLLINVLILIAGAAAWIATKFGPPRTE